MTSNSELVELFKEWAECWDGRQMTLTIPLSPVPASRPRVTKWGVHYTKTYAQWKRQARLYLPDNPDPIFGSGALVVCAEFIVKKPRTTKRAYPIGDTDNYMKAAMDAVTACGSVWHDDDQVVSSVELKRYAEEDETPCTELFIVEL